MTVNYKILVAFFIAFFCACCTYNEKRSCASALMDASLGGDTTQVVNILQREKTTSCIDSKSSYYDFTALMYAAEFGHVDVVKELLKHKANPNIGNKYKVTALMLASGNGYNAVVSELLKNKADPNLANKYGVTPLMYAARKGYIDVVITLLKNGANPNLKDNSNLSALAIAQKNNYHEIIKKLEAAGAKQ